MSTPATRPPCASNSPPRAGRRCEAHDQVDAGDSSPPPAAAIVENDVVVTVAAAHQPQNSS
jgi:hypothetical protein